LQKDHRPYFIKKIYLDFQKFYVKRFLHPQFESLGKNFFFMKPWYVEIFGAPIMLGNYATVIAARDNKIRFTVWPERKGEGSIQIGDYCLVCPGVRISSASAIDIGNSCMIASNAYITDSDWHDTYNRIAVGTASHVKIGENVWIGDSAIVCKGVAIGDNSIIGAGAVVVNSVPPNTIAAGNPARVVKTLDPEKPIITRAEWFSDPDRLFEEIDQWDRAMLRDNTLLGWLRSLLSPTKED
jgi:acetyltransferase-like isoleucine patch superfamily enzyme